MKIGDYVRTEYGISKIIGIYPNGKLIFIETDNGLGDCTCCSEGKLRRGILILEEDYRCFIDNNVKQKLIDLIEVGDYVNKHKVIYISGNIYVEYVNMDELLEIKPEQIKSIVTKEQFESMEYKL